MPSGFLESCQNLLAPLVDCSRWQWVSLALRSLLNRLYLVKEEACVELPDQKGSTGHCGRGCQHICPSHHPVPSSPPPPAPKSLIAERWCSLPLAAPRWHLHSVEAQNQLVLEPTRFDSQSFTASSTLFIHAYTTCIEDVAASHWLGSAPSIESFIPSNHVCNFWLRGLAVSLIAKGVSQDLVPCLLRSACFPAQTTGHFSLLIPL